MKDKNDKNKSCTSCQNYGICIGREAMDGFLNRTKGYFHNGVNSEIFTIVGSKCIYFHADKE